MCSDKLAHRLLYRCSEIFFVLENFMERNMSGKTETSLGHFALLSWKSILAGFLVTLLASSILFALGMGVGGATLKNILDRSELGPMAVGSVVWIFLTVFLSLFIGSYFAARVSNFITDRI